MKKCLLEVYNQDTKVSEWIEGLVTGTRARVDLDKNGYDVKTTDGRYFEGCHPDCVKFQ